MTGQDGLRDEIAAIIREHIFGNDTPSDEADCCADAVLPVVQRHIDAAREQVADAEAATTRMFGLVNHARAERDAAVARAEQAEQALEVLGRERNAWARQLADAHDERDTARAELEQVRSERSEDRQTVYRIEALIAEWEQLDRADGVHGRQLRRALDGTP